MPRVFLQETALPVSKIRGKHPAKPLQNAHFLPKTGDFSTIFSATVFFTDNLDLDREIIVSLPGDREFTEFPNTDTDFRLFLVAVIE